MQNRFDKLAWPGIWAGIALLYFLTARSSLLLAFEHTNVSPVWPPSGLALAAFWICGRRIWPGILIGACAANAWGFIANHAGGWAAITAVSLAIGAGNTLEAFAGNLFLRRRSDAPSSPFGGVSDVFRFVGIAMIAPLPACAIGATSLGAGGLAPWSLYGEMCYTWWLGDMAGMLVFAPAVIAAWNLRRALFRDRLNTRTILWILAWMGAAYAIFMGWLPVSNSPSVAYFALPLLMVIVFRKGQGVAAIAVAAIAAIAVWRTVDGSGLFSLGPLHERLLMLQAFLCVISVTVLFLEAALSEKRQAYLELRSVNDNLEKKVRERTETLERQAAELHLSNSELEKFNRASVGRELRIIELKREINRLLADLGRPPGYDLSAHEPTRAA